MYHDSARKHTIGNAGQKCIRSFPLPQNAFAVFEPSSIRYSLIFHSRMRDGAAAPVYKYSILHVPSAEPGPRDVARLSAL